MLLFVCFVVADSYAANSTPVILNIGVSQRKEVYEKVLKYSFVTARHPNFFKGLKNEEINRLVEDEPGLIQEKIAEVANNAEIHFIPKSLYQLLALSYVLDDCLSCNDKNDFDQRHNYYLYTVGFLDNSLPLENGVLSAITNYQNKSEIQALFWNVNAYIVKRLDNTFNLTKEGLMKLVENIGTKFEKTYHGITQNLFGGCRFRISGLEGMIANLILEENNASKTTYRVYRGERQLTEYSFQTSYSFSDGLFGGFLRDIGSGAALVFALKRRNLLCMDLSKKALLIGNFETLPVIIPPVIYFGSFSGQGEFHHVRTRSINKEPSGDYGWEQPLLDMPYKQDYLLYFCLEENKSANSAVEDFSKALSYSVRTSSTYAITGDFWTRGNTVSVQTLDLSNENLE